MAGIANGAEASDSPSANASNQTEPKQSEAPTPAPKPIQFPGAFESQEYSVLSKLSVALNKGVTHDEGSFNICFWIYLVKNTGAGVVIRQGRPRALSAIPFITLDNERKLTLHPLPPPPLTSAPADFSLSSNATLTSDIACPLEKWIHVGAEVGPNLARLHIDTVVVAQKEIPADGGGVGGDAGPVLLSGGDGSPSGGSVQAYAHFVRLLRTPEVTQHYVKNPPLELTLDTSETGEGDDNEIEVSSDGIWSVVGGKASCRRNFNLEVALMDALGRPVHREIDVQAVLIYADDNCRVTKLKEDAEVPLLSTVDGVEYPSTDVPVRLIHGRATFKLKISQLSSKCDNRLFRVCFEPVGPTPRHPFLRALSRPIRCVSRVRVPRQLPHRWGPEFLSKHDLAILPESPGARKKRRLNGGASPAGAFDLEFFGKEEGLSFLDAEIQKSALALMGGQPREPPPSAQNGSAPAQREPIHTENGGFQDQVVYKYSLESMASRGEFLKAAVKKRSEADLAHFAERVAQCTGCRHNGYQIAISKRLLQDGDDLWERAEAAHYPVVLGELLRDVEHEFQRLTGATERAFSERDRAFLKHVIVRGTHYCSRTEFERLWHWLYPVALTLANPQLRELWESGDPWIAGFLTRGEAEVLLAPHPEGTFLLRFGPSRVWPHPDAGALVASVVATGGEVVHRLLTIDTGMLSPELADERPPLMVELLAQPELRILYRPEEVLRIEGAPAEETQAEHPPSETV